MMKMFIPFLFLLVFLFFAQGCTPASPSVVCNEPYITVGIECCLDKDSNSICDRDEASEPAQTAPSIPEPTCGDTICQETEGCDSCYQDCGECYTITDLQADIGNVYFDAQDEFLLLEKDQKIGNVQFYVFKVSKSTRLGDNTAGNPIFKVLPKRFIVVSIFEEGEDILQEGAPFFNFIKKHENYLTHSLQRNERELIKEFKEGNHFKELQKDQDITEYVSHTATDNVLADGIQLLETVSKKIVTRDHVTLKDYTFVYKKEGNFTKEVTLTGVNYLQSASIFCTPRITLTIYHEEIPAIITLNEVNIDNYYRNNKRGITSDAQALINMCEDRYEFSYWRGR